MNEIKNATVKEIVYEWLKANKYDGLLSGDGVCQCNLDDLMCCGDGCSFSCRAAYQHICDFCDDCRCDEAQEYCMQL